MLEAPTTEIPCRPQGKDLFGHHIAVGQLNPTPSTTCVAAPGEQRPKAFSNFFSSCFVLGTACVIYEIDTKRVRIVRIFALTIIIEVKINTDQMC